MDKSLGLILAFSGGAAIGTAAATLGGGIIVTIALSALWAFFLIAIVNLPQK